MSKNPEAHSKLLEPEQLETLRTSATCCIVDLSSADNYLRAHIPGALHLPFQALIGGGFPAPGKLGPLEQLHRVLKLLGANKNTRFIAVDDEGGGWAGRFLWTLHVLGIDNFAYLNGGMHAWLQSGLPVQSGEPVYPDNGDLTPVVNQQRQITREQLKRQLADNKVCIWDARSAAEFHAGHMPGAKHLEWTSLMDSYRGLRVRADAAALIQRAEIDGDIVTHCQSHHRSGFTWLVGHLYDLNIKAYDGSWAEWCAFDDSPIVTSERS